MAHFRPSVSHSYLSLLTPIHSCITVASHHLSPLSQVNDRTKNVYVAWAGTRSQFIVRDGVVNDLGAVVVGLPAPRFIRASSTMADVVGQFPGYSISAYGHSLGGALVRMCSLITTTLSLSHDAQAIHAHNRFPQVEVHAYNPAGISAANQVINGVAGLFDPSVPSSQHKSCHIHYVRSDVVALHGLAGTHAHPIKSPRDLQLYTYQKKDGNGAHAIDNFLPQKGFCDVSS